MLKLRIISLAIGLLLLPMSIFAKSGVYDKGYRGNVGITTLEIVQRHMVGHLIQLESVHGYSFGNGGFVGVGTGLSFNYIDSDYGMHVLLPVFIDGKYNFLEKNNVSPFAGFRTGFRAGISDEAFYTFLSPSAGVDIGRFSLRVGYEIGNGSSTDLDAADVIHHNRLHYLFAGFSFSF